MKQLQQRIETEVMKGKEKLELPQERKREGGSSSRKEKREGEGESEGCAIREVGQTSEGKGRGEEG